MALPHRGPPSSWQGLPVGARSLVTQVSMIRPRNKCAHSRLVDRRSGGEVSIERGKFAEVKWKWERGAPNKSIYRWYFFLNVQHAHEYVLRERQTRPGEGGIPARWSKFCSLVDKRFGWPPNTTFLAISCQCAKVFQIIQTTDEWTGMRLMETKSWENEKVKTVEPAGANRLTCWRRDEILRVIVRSILLIIAKATPKSSIRVRATPQVPRFSLISPTLRSFSPFLFLIFISNFSASLSLSLSLSHRKREKGNESISAFDAPFIVYCSTHFSTGWYLMFTYKIRQWKSFALSLALYCWLSIILLHRYLCTCSVIRISIRGRFQTRLKFQENRTAMVGGKNCSNRILRVDCIKRHPLRYGIGSE